MILHVGSNYTKIVNPSHIPQLRMILSFKIPTNIHILRAKMPEKPWWLLKKIASQGQTVNLLDLRNLTFPSGLVHTVQNYCSKEGVPLTVRDARDFTFGTGTNWLFMKKLRDYQLEPADAALTAKHGILNVATRGGKTVLAQYISAKIKKPTLFFVNSIELLNQAVKSWHAAFPLKRIGIVGSGTYDPQEITVATVQTLLKEKDAFKELYDYFQIVFFDEVHHFGGLAFFRTAMRFKAPFRFGLSGTAFRNDEAGITLTALCGEIVAKVTTDTLVKEGVVYRTHVLFQKCEIPPHYPPSGRDFHKLYEWGITLNPYRNDLAVRWAIRLRNAGLTVLIIVKTIEHGKLLQGALCRRTKDPMACRFMNGQEGKLVRADTLKRFCKGEIPFLIGTKIYNEGVDFVGLENHKIRGKSVILAAGGRSKIASIQTAARPTTKEKRPRMLDEALIIDFTDKFHKLLYRHAKERHKSYSDLGGFKISVVESPAFYSIK